MASPVGGRLSEAFKETYLAAGLTQLDVEAGLHERGFTNVDQPLISKWARGMRAIPLEVLPALDDVLGETKGYLLRKAGYVDPIDKADVQAAIAVDPELDEDGRTALTLLYRVLKSRAGQPVGKREHLASGRTS